MASDYPISADRFERRTNSGLTVEGESHQIPASAPYKITLDELPRGPRPQLDGSVIPTTLQIQGFTEITAGTPQPGQFLCTYSTGEVLFHSSDATKTVICNYITAGDFVLAERVNELQEPLEKIEDDLVGSHRGLKVVIDGTGSTIRVFPGDYGRAGEYRSYAGATGQSHASWTTAGTYYVYISSSDALVLNGVSFPNDGIPVCTVTTEDGGAIATLTDKRVQLNEPAGGGVATGSQLLSFYLPGVLSTTGGAAANGKFIDAFFMRGGPGKFTIGYFNCITPPSGGNTQIRINNVTQATSVTTNLAQNGSFAMNMNFALNDEIEVEVLAVGTQPAGDVNLVLWY